MLLNLETTSYGTYTSLVMITLSYAAWKNAIKLQYMNAFVVYAIIKLLPRI